MGSKLLFLLFILPVQMLFAQDQMRIDSLQIRLSNAKEDTSKVKILIDLSDTYYGKDAIKALQYAKEALQVSGDINSELFKTRSYIKIGNNLILIGNYDEALANFLSALKISQQNNFEYEELISYNSLGIIQDRIDKFDEALKYYFEALNIYNKAVERGEPIHKMKNIQGLYNNIGNIYLSKNILNTAEEYYLKGLKLSEEKLDYNNIGKVLRYELRMSTYFSIVEVC